MYRRCGHTNCRKGQDNMSFGSETRFIGPNWGCGHWPGESAKFTGIKTGLLGTGLKGMARPPVIKIFPRVGASLPRG